MNDNPVDTEAVKTRQREMVERALAQSGRDVAGRVVVVTGGARGIGKAVSQAMLAAGAKVAAADKTWSGAEEFRAELEGTGCGLALTMDLSKDAELDQAYAATMDRFGTVDVLVNNAALVSETLFAPLGHVNTLDTKDSDWETMFGVNVFGTVKMIRRFIRPMLEKKRGSIVNVVSSGVLPVSIGGGYYGLRPGTVEMPYQATKAAVMALTFYLGEEVLRQGVAVNAIMPGHTRASWFDATARAYQDQGMAYFMRPAVAEHVLPIMLFLGGQDGRGVTGRLYYVPDWNYDHGYGNYAAWLDHDLPPDMEATYASVEKAMPKYERSGVSHLPFDALRMGFTSAMTTLSSGEGPGGGTKR
jgi:NAD(P)-dependent dehydrogenase (short-subunit alcohol dehydrogenase family)